MESKKPLISIICAIRNDARFIRETLESVVKQTYSNWELIVMDAVSTDGTLDIVKEFAAKYPNIIWRSEPDKGQWDALDKALALSKGEYLFQLCGQDGYLNENWFAECVAAFENQPEVSLVWGIPFNMSEDGKLLGPHYSFAGYLPENTTYGSKTKLLDTIAAKIDWSRPGSIKRLFELLGKMTWSRFLLVIRNSKKRGIPQKADWFSHWLKTSQAFPEGNMCVRKDVYVRNTVRFPEETMTNAALFDFCYNFNANGYLAYGLPVVASFGRTHIGGQPLWELDQELFRKYKQQVKELRERVEKQKIVKFVNPEGEVIFSHKLER